MHNHRILRLRRMFLEDKTLIDISVDIFHFIINVNTTYDHVYSVIYIFNIDNDRM
jgi:hypothetical protein